MSLFKKKVELYNPLKKPNFILWCLVILGIFAFIGAVFLKNVGLALLFGLILCIWLFVKLFFINGIDGIDDRQCIHLFGLPGSGKSFFMAREGFKLKKKTGRKIAVNKIFEHYKPKDFVCSRDDLGHKDLGEKTLLLWDEGNLDGFDNRRSKENFKDYRTLEFFLKHRQNSNPIMITTQGYNTLDKKIREDVTTDYYFCRSYFGGKICVAQKLYLDMQLDPITSEPTQYYKGAMPIEALLCKDSWLFGLPQFQNRGLYSTKVRTDFDRGSFVTEQD